MSTTTRAATRGFVHVHRAALTVVVLSIALVVTLGLLTARLVTDSTPAPTTPVPTVHLSPVYGGCQPTRPAQPC